MSPHRLKLLCPLFGLETTADKAQTTLILLTQHQDLRYPKEQSYNLRESEAMTTLRSQDGSLKGQLLRFRLSCLQSASSVLEWVWQPDDAKNMDAEQIAADVEKESSLRFSRVSFRDWVSHFAGHRKESVKFLVLLHQLLCQNIHEHLKRHPKEKEKYKDVATVSLLNH